jgi:hypothetical protein
VSYGGLAHGAFPEEYRNEIRAAIQTDLSVRIQRNEKVWKLMLSSFETGLKARIDRGTQQVLEKLNEDPHTKITNLTLRRIWEEEVRAMGSKFTLACALNVSRMILRNGPTP